MSRTYRKHRKRKGIGDDEVPVGDRDCYRIPKPKWRVLGDKVVEDYWDDVYGNSRGKATRKADKKVIKIALEDMI